MQSVHPFVLLALMELLEMPLEIEIRLTFASTQSTKVRLGGGDHTSSFQEIELSSFLALLTNPRGDMDEGLSVGISDDINDRTEVRSSLTKVKGSMEGRKLGGFVVKVPEDRNCVVQERVRVRVCRAADRDAMAGEGLFDS